MLIAVSALLRKLCGKKEINIFVSVIRKNLPKYI